MAYIGNLSPKRKEAFANISEGIVGALDIIGDFQKQKRAESLLEKTASDKAKQQDQEITIEALKAGYDPSSFKSMLSGEGNGISSLIRNPEGERKYQEDIKKSQLLDIQLKEAERKAKEEGLPITQTRDFQKEALKTKIATEAKAKVDADAQELKELNEENKQATEAQRKAQGFLEKMAVSGRQYDELIKSGDYDPASRMSKIAPLDILKSPSRLNFENTSAAWIQSVLRPESGAVIGPSELISYRETYFPVPGDTETAIKNKNELRKIAEKQLSVSAGSSKIKDMGKASAQIDPQRARLEELRIKKAQMSQGNANIIPSTIGVK